MPAAHKQTDSKTECQKERKRYDMSKNKKRRPNSPDPNGGLQVLTFSEGTILEQFQEYFLKHRKVSDIIGFLAVQNARLLGMLGMGDGKLSREMEDQVLEFVEFFDENFAEITEEARMENWGSVEPLILRLADSIADQRWMEEQEELLRSMTPALLHEAETLRDTIIGIRKNKMVAIACEEELFEVEIPRTLPRKELEEFKKLFLYDMALVIREKGAVTVRCEEKEGFSIFGIRTTPVGMWVPVPAEEMKKAHTITTTGIELEPEEDTVYTSIQRELF